MKRPLAIFVAVFVATGLVAVETRGDDGLLLVGRLNCTACHAATDRQTAWLMPHGAPRLRDIGNRASAEWLQKHLATPDQTIPGNSMPDLLRGNQDEAELLTHYLLSPGQASFRRSMPDRAAVARGEILFHQIGCVACHQPRNSVVQLSDSVALPQMAEKWSFDALRQFLKDPLATRPSGRMPAMNLSDREASDLAHYLLRETRVPATLEVAQYRGPIRALEDIDTAELARTMPANGFSLEGFERERNFAIRFTGWLWVEVEGDHVFHLAATGASRLGVDGQWLVGEDSWRRESVDESAARHLTAGWHPIALDFVQRGRNEPALRVEWDGPGMTRQILPPERLQSSREAVAEPAPFVVDAVKAEKGRQLYLALNCAACHEGNPTADPPPPLAALQAGRGCLEDMPTGRVPDYHLDAAQRDALQRTLTFLNRADLEPPSPRQIVARTMASFNCTACHARDGVGGVTAERDPFFTSNGEDLGDEGRIPPTLDGVGDRLRPTWLSNVLTSGAGVRPYLNTRMPQFGPANVGHLADLFVTLDRQVRPDQSSPDSLDARREAGRQLVGTDGLSCIACHRFNRQPAHAMQVIDLTTTTDRLNEDWFRRFLLDPNLFHPGTRMPAFWPDGESLMPGVLGGNTARQHAAIWTYLADGPRAIFPEGLSRENVELIVGGEAVNYRGKMWEAGFRAMATGYPGQVNTAFDAEEMRLALLWRGAFLNVGPHWGIQGMGRIRPIGTDIVVFPHGAPLAVLTSADEPWPETSGGDAGMKFSGYQLDSLKRPTLLYSFRQRSIEDSFIPTEVAGRPGLRRTMKFIDLPPDGLHLRVAVGKLTAVGDDVWRLDDALNLRVLAGATAFVRGDGDVQELIAPVPATGGTNQLEIDYVW